MAPRSGETWRLVGAAATIAIVTLTCLVVLPAQRAPASQHVQPADPCAVVAPGPPPLRDQPPVAAFTAMPTTVDAGQAVTFDGSGSHSSVGTLASWCWKFGDGTHAFGAKVSHTYAGPGTDAVALTVTDAYGLTGRAFGSITVTGAGTIRLVLKETAHDAANRLRSGERVRLYGSVVPARPGRVVIEREAGGHFNRVLVGELHSSDGAARFSVVMAIVRGGTYRARLAGTSIASPRVTLRLRASGARAACQ
jgi:PKD domain-containing protein